MHRLLKLIARTCNNLSHKMFTHSISAYRNLSLRKSPDCPMPAKTGGGYEQLVNQLLSTPSTRLAILGPDGAGKTEFIQGIIGDSRIQDVFGSHCTFVSCDGAATAGAVLGRLVQALGVIVETGNDAISTILEHLAAHNHTLILLDKLDAIYLPDSPEQQEETDILLATLAAVDELTLIVSFSGATLPECIAWVAVEEARENSFKHEPQAGLTNEGSPEGGTVQVIASNDIAQEEHAMAMLEASHDAEHEQLVFQLLTTPSARLAIPEPEPAENAAFVRRVISDARVQDHFAGRCAFVSCGDALSAGAVLDRLTAELRVVEGGCDAIAAVLKDLATYDRTLIVFNKLEALYSPAESEQQEETDVLLATLAAVDELTLVVTFNGESLPQCVAWTTVEQSGDHPFKPERQEVSSCEESPSFIATQVDFDQKAALEGSYDVIPVRSSALIVADTAAEDAGSESEFVYIPTAPRTVFESKLPPARPAVFHGRDEEVDRLVEQALVPSSAPLGIVGPGGIGKTTLALKVLHHPQVREHFGKERLFVSCEDATHPDEVLGRLANKLDVQRSQGMSLWTAVLGNLRSRQRMFIVLDNFESIWSPTDDVLREASEVFLAQFAVLDNLTLIVTTRGNHLPEAFTWANIDTAELDTLSPVAAHRTFTDLSCLKPQVLASNSEARALVKLLREIDFMPLAITLLARLDDLPSSLLREWSEYHTEVLEADRHDGTRRELSVEVSIKISLAHLPRETAEAQPRRLLSVCGQLPAGLSPEFSDKLSTIIANIDWSAQALLRHSLVYYGRRNELRILSPVRHYVSVHLPMLTTVQWAVEDVYALQIYSCPHPVESALQGPPSYAATYDPEIPNVISMLKTALDRLDEQSAIRASLFACYCLARSRPCLPLLQKLLLQSGDVPEMKILSLMLIGAHNQLAGDEQLSIEPYEQAAELCARVGLKLGEASSLSAMSGSLRALGRYQEAESYEAKSDAMKRDLSLKWARPAPGEDVAAAEQRYREAREDSLRAGDNHSVMVLTAALLDVVSQRNDKEAYVKELQLAIDVGNQMAAGGPWFARVELDLGRIYIDKGKVEEAEDILPHAYAIQIEIVDDPLTLARIVMELARLRRLQQRHDESLSLLETAAGLYHDSGKISLAEGWKQKAAECRALLARGLYS